MFESLIGAVVVIVLFVIVLRQQGRIGLIERELGALRSLVLSGVNVAAPAAKAVEAAATDSLPADAAQVPAAVADIASPTVAEAAQACRQRPQLPELRPPACRRLLPVRPALPVAARHARLKGRGCAARQARVRQGRCDSADAK